MNKKNWNIYQATGIIIDKEIDKTYSQARPKQPFYRLKVRLEKDPTKKISVFPDKLTNPTIWTDLEQHKFIDRRYLFKFVNYMGQYHLVD